MKHVRLERERFASGDYALRPIFLEDMVAIRIWRNDQMEVLRQARPLSEADQQAYYHNRILPSYERQNTDIILFCFEHEGSLIGYGGLTNLDWTNMRGEISFLMRTDRSDRTESEQYRRDFTAFLELVKAIAFEELHLHRIYTETFNIRDFHIRVLERCGFVPEGRMRDHVYLQGRFVDSLIHGCIKE